MTGIVVVNWNGAAATCACLESLRGLGQASRRVYVVDNGSSDGSPELILAAYPECTLVRGSSNRGYAAGCNLGLERALSDGCSHVWLLNNDTRVEPGTLDTLLAAGRGRELAILAPRILHDDGSGRTWSAGGTLDWRLKSHHVNDSASASANEADHVRAVDWASGCSLFLSAAAVRALGPMDERYFLYLEDVEWCLRGRRKSIPTLFVPEAIVYHTVSDSVGRLGDSFVCYYAWRNYYLLVQRQGTWFQRSYGLADLVSRLIKVALRLSLSEATRRDPVYRARVRGLIDFVRGSFGPKEQERALRHTRLVEAIPR